MVDRTGYIIMIVAAAVMLLAVLFTFSGCGAQKYKVTYWDGEEFFKEGKTVTLYFDLIATDTDYSFDVLGADDYELGYSDTKGYSITFMMPANDVTVSVASKNSMVYEPEYETVPGKLLFDYYRATSAVGGGHYEITLYTAEDPNFIELCQYVKDSDEDPEICRSYLVDAVLLEHCMDIVERYGMQNWNSMDDTVAIDGVTVVCKFNYGSEFIRVSTDIMPADGEAAMAEIRNLLEAEMKEEYFVYETEVGAAVEE